MVSAASNEPIANARVELFTGPNTPIAVRSDGGGRFAFNDLAAGVYRIRVTRDGYLRQEFGARALGLPGSQIRLTAGQRMTDVQFTLTPAPTLAGFVNDDQGEPLPDVLVQAMRPSYDPRGNPILQPEFFALTDDLGRYRLFWVDPMEFIISATATPDIAEILGSPPNANRVRSPQGFVPTYHTGGTDPQGIEPLSIKGATEAQGLDFHLARNPHRAIRGYALQTVGKTDKATVELAPLVRVTTGPLRRLETKDGGLFEINGVTPGKYLVSARAPSGARGVVQIDVTSEDVNEIRIPLLPPGTVSGQVYLDSQSTLDFQQLRIGLTPLDAGLHPPADAGIQSKGAFTLDRVETGAYRVEIFGLPANTYLAGARIGDVDALQNDVVVDGTQASPLELLLKVDGGAISGTVSDAEGKPMSGAYVALVPEITRRRPDRYRTAITDERGNFTLRGIPPGEYAGYAWERVEPYAILNAEFMARHAESGVTARVAPGSNPPIALRAITRR
jgi:protocatechuate 3,4-dioxygenase beta subunit